MSLDTSTSASKVTWTNQIHADIISLHTNLIKGLSAARGKFFETTSPFYAHTRNDVLEFFLQVVNTVAR